MQALESGWRGDHTFNAGATQFSLEHFLEPEVQKNNPTWSIDQIRTEASRRMEFRLAQDKTFTDKETRRDSDMVTKWEVQDVDGKPQLVTRYGNSYISLETLWLHTKEYAQSEGVPAAFNEGEMKMQLAIADALIIGKVRSAAFALSHPDSIRYVQTWRRGSDGTFSSTQIDIGRSAGRDLQHHEVSLFLGKMSDTISKQAVRIDGVNEHSYVATRGVIEETNVKRVAQSFVRSDTPIWAASLQDESPRPVFPFVPSLPSDYERVKEPKEVRRETPGYLRIIRDPRFFDQAKHKPADKQPKVEEPKQPESIAKKVDIIKEERKEVVPVAAPAIPLLLEKLVAPPPSDVKAMEKSIRRKAKTAEKHKASLAKETRPTSARSVESKLVYERKRKKPGEFHPKKNKEKKRLKVEQIQKKAKEKRRLKRRLITERVIQPSVSAERRRKRKKNREILNPKKRKDRYEGRKKNGVKAVEREEPRGMKKRKIVLPETYVMVPEIRRTEARRVRKVIERMMKVLIARKPPATRHEHHGKTSEKVKLSRKEFVTPVFRLPFGISLFFLLRQTDTKPQNDSRLSLEIKRGALPQKKETLWILLSIIWYLAMLRESGRGQAKTRILPRAGVIFVANRGMIKSL